MALNWIKMRTDLGRDPAVIYLSEHYGWQEHVIVGLLHKLWSWADEQVENGNAVGVTYSFINRYLGVTDFAQQLENVGWIEQNKHGISFPNWDRHMSQTAKRRALTSQRVASHRCNAASVTKVLPDKNREEKRRSKKESKPKKKFVPPTVDEVSSYCQERDKGVDPQKWYDHYEANGWMVGKVAMKDWRAAVRTWEGNSGKYVVNSKKDYSITKI